MLHLTTSPESAREAAFTFQLVRPTAEESSLYLVQKQRLLSAVAGGSDVVEQANSVLAGREVARE